MQNGKDNLCDIVYNQFMKRIDKESAVHHETVHPGFPTFKHPSSNIDHGDNANQDADAMNITVVGSKHRQCVKKRNRKV